MPKPRTALELVAERLIHTAEALGLSSKPEQRAAAERFKKMIETELAKLKRAPKAA